MIPSRSLPQGLGSRALLGPLRCGDPGSTVWQSAGFAGRGSRKYRDTCAAVLFMASSAMKSSKYKIRVPSYRTPKNLSKQVRQLVATTRRQPLQLRTNAAARSTTMDTSP